MGVDIFLKWTNMTPEETILQIYYNYGYIRESYSGSFNYPSHHLVPEAFEEETEYDVEILRERLPKALVICDRRCEDFGLSYSETNEYRKQYIEFVELAEWKQKLTGNGVIVSCSW